MLGLWRTDPTRRNAPGLRLSFHFTCTAQLHRETGRSQESGLHAIGQELRRALLWRISTVRTRRFHVLGLPFNRMAQDDTCILPDWWYWIWNSWSTSTKSICHCIYEYPPKPPPTASSSNTAKSNFQVHQDTPWKRCHLSFNPAMDAL